MKKFLLSSVFLLALGGVSVLVYDYVSKPTMSAIQTNKYMKKQSVSIREFDENTSLDLSNEKITSTDLVLYENGRGFVSQNRQVLLKKGLQEINFGKIPEGLILSSVSVSGKNIALQTINFDPHFDEKTYYEVAQEEAIGKEVTLLWTVWKEGVKSEIKQNATLLAVEQGTPILQIDGMIHKGTDARILYPALKSDVENKKRSLDFSVVSDTDKKQELTFSYLTNGFNWSTNYNLYLDEDKNEMTLKGIVDLKNNTQLDYKNANIDFVLGEINTIYESLPGQENEPICQINNKSGIKLADSPITVNGNRLKENDGQLSYDEEGHIYDKGYLIGRISNDGYLGRLEKAAQVLDLKDYYVYRLPFKTNLKKGQAVSAVFLNKGGLAYQKEYTFNSPIRFTYTKDIQNVAPQLEIVFQNNVSSGIEMPLPKGTFHVFNTKDGKEFFVGEAKVDKTISLGQKAVINIGEALDVYANIKEAGFKRVTDEKAEYSYKVDIRNVSNEDKQINFKQALSPEYKFLNSDLKPAENIPSSVVWNIDIKANQVQSFTFSIEYTDLDLVKKKQDVELEKEKLAAQEARLEAEKEYQRLKLQKK